MAASFDLSSPSSRSQHRYPTASYSVTCDHARRIMSCSGGFPGTFNDKTISRYDEFITSVGSLELFTHFPYQITTETGHETRYGFTHAITSSPHKPIHTRRISHFTLHISRTTLINVQVFTLFVMGVIIIGGTWCAASSSRAVRTKHCSAARWRACAN